MESIHAHQNSNLLFNSNKQSSNWHSSSLISSMVWNFKEWIKNDNWLFMMYWIIAHKQTTETIDKLLLWGKFSNRTELLGTKCVKHVLRRHSMINRLHKRAVFMRVTLSSGNGWLEQMAMLRSDLHNFKSRIFSLNSQPPPVAWLADAQSDHFIQVSKFWGSIYIAIQYAFNFTKTYNSVLSQNRKPNFPFLK